MLHKKYKKNYLTRVIARIDFAIPISKLKDNMDANLLKSIKKYFQIMEEVVETKIPENLSIKAWQFYGKNREKNLKICKDFIYIEYLKYTDFIPLKKEFISILSRDRKSVG